jgi:hypothetical protein
MSLADKQTSRVFRRCFSSIATDSVRYRQKAIKAQLAHCVRDDVGVADNRAQ